MIWGPILLVLGLIAWAIVLAVVAEDDKPVVRTNSADIQEMKEAMVVSIPRPNYMWIGDEAAQALGLPGSGAYERVNDEWIKRSEL